MTNSTQQQTASNRLSPIEKDMTSRLAESLDGFLLNFIKTWESSANPCAITMAIIMILLKQSLDTAEVIVEDCAKQDFDLLDKMSQTIAEHAEKMRQEYPAVAALSQVESK